MRAVIYARYSSDLQNEASIEDQVRVCDGFLASRGWVKSQVYADRARSGSNKLRPAYQQMLIDARSGQFDVVVAEALDRLSRDQEDVAALFKALRFAGIALFTLAEGEISELHVGLKGTMNALFLKDLAAKTHRGLRGRIEDKRSAGGISYGYRVVREHDAKGEPVRGKRQIEPGEAKNICRIFDEFTKGASPRAIAKRLNQEGIPGPNGNPWQDTTIRGHAKRGTGILRNEIYVGRLVWNRQRFLRDPETGKRIARPNPPDQWVIEDVPELRILSDDLWLEAKARLDEIAASPVAMNIKASAFWTKTRPKHILTGLVHCGACGHPMAAVGKDYLRCARSMRSGTCTSKASVRRSYLEEIVITGLQHNLMAPDLVKEFVTAANEEFNRARKNEMLEREERQGRLPKIEKQIESLVEAIASGMRSASINEKLESLEAERAALLKNLGGPTPSPIRLLPNLAEAYRKKVSDLHAAIYSQDTRDEAFQIIRTLIDKVLIHDGANKKPTIELVGDIASMISIALPSSKTQKTARERAVLSDRDIRSVKVVAGTGFEPVTFRL